MTVDIDIFKACMGHFPAGVTIVTMKVEDDPEIKRHAMTVSAFSSISAEPPLIMVAINQSVRSNAWISSAGAFGVNILAAGQENISNRCAWGDEDRFEFGDWTTKETGSPILANALAWLDCEIAEEVQAGSHTIFIGEVLSASLVQPNTPPLIYWNRAYRQIRPTNKLTI